MIMMTFPHLPLFDALRAELVYGGQLGLGFRVNKHFAFEGTK